jgi:hypothetical protein
MNNKFLLVSIITFAAWLAAVSCTTRATQTNSAALSEREILRTEPRNQDCLPADALAKGLRQLSSNSEGETAQLLLINVAERSPECRLQVIRDLMLAMDKPNLNFREHMDDYYLWRFGAAILGHLKATEALDLLISHLTSRTATFSTSMSHQPALAGVIELGPVAIPKLVTVLNTNPDPEMRFFAVYCIATIGGPSARESLEQVLPSETDTCVSQFIRVSLASFDSDGIIRDRGKWFPGGLCDK